jgi:hypothetical protein
MPLNDDHLRAIGRIAVTFNHLEQTAGWAVKVFMGGKDLPVIVGDVFTTGESFDRLISKLRTLARFRLPYPDLLEELEECIRSAKEVQDSRNRVLHSGWIWWKDLVQEADVATALRQSARDVLGNIQDYTPRDLDAIADRIREVDQALERLTARIASVPLK